MAVADLSSVSYGLQQSQQIGMMRAISPLALLTTAAVVLRFVSNNKSSKFASTSVIT